MAQSTLGESIPADTPHAISVSLPTWQSNVGYEEGQDWVVSRMTTGYPRFFIHKCVDALARHIADLAGPGRRAFLFPTHAAATRCLDFIRRFDAPGDESRLEIIDFVLDDSRELPPLLKPLSPTISAAVFPPESFATAKQYWQHTGDGVSSRRAEFCHALLRKGLLVRATSSKNHQPPSGAASAKPCRGPKRYARQSPTSTNGVDSPPRKSPSPIQSVDELKESFDFLEERYGRNLDLSSVERARSAIRRRIAGSLIHDPDHSIPSLSSQRQQSLGEGDVYLFPTGMNAIFHAHRALLSALGSRKSINFGFPYVDTLKVLEKFGPGCAFYGHSTSAALDDLEASLKSGDRFLALFCEFPGNPLLTCPDLQRIRKLADAYDFAVVVDETIGTFANVDVLQHADIVVSSLTKIFSGDSNVMGGCAILNPESRYYSSLKQVMDTEVYEDAYWPEDVVFLERNSRDFSSRVKRTNVNAEAISDILREHPLVKELYYPKFNASRPCYDACRLPAGGFGGLLSVVFHKKRQAEVFYDAIDTAKGPSLGTNFTLCSPYTLLAHYNELSWAAQFGVSPDLIRISVGLEETSSLQQTFRSALEAAEAVPED